MTDAPGVAVGAPPASRARGVAALALAGFLFGSTFLVVGRAIESTSVPAFLAVRFTVGGAVLWPLARRRRATAGEVRHGVLAGGCLLAGFVLQTEGLRTTTPAASAFITYLLVVLVPVIGVLRSRRLPGANVVAGVGLAVVGLVLLTGGGATGFGRGEVLTMGSALAFALHLVVVGEVAGHHDPFRFTFWQVVTVAALCLVPGALATGGYGFAAPVWLAAAFCGVGATAGAFWAMAWGQRVVPQSEAAIILMLEPVSAGVLGQFTGERLGPAALLGAALILAAVAVAELLGGRSIAVGGELAANAQALDTLDPRGPSARADG